MGYDLFDSKECDGQMSLEDLFPAPETMFAVSKIFARAKKNMSLNELKTFIYALTKIRWTEPNSEYIYLEKKVLASVLGNKSDTNHLSQNLWDEIKNLPQNSFIEIADDDKDYNESGCIITRITRLKDRFRLKIESDYMPLFTGLKDNYITMWSTDIFQMTSTRSVDFYEDLRLSSDTRGISSKGFGIKAFKDLLGIPKEAYMREKGGFNRTEFEQKVIKPICEDLKKCKMLNLIQQPGGLLYEKVKQNGRVLGYRFYWTVSEHPNILSGTEIEETRQALEKNPELLKIAKDVVNGAKKPKKTSFSTNHEHNYDFEALEKEIVSNN